MKKLKDSNKTHQSIQERRQEEDVEIIIGFQEFVSKLFNLIKDPIKMILPCFKCYIHDQ